MKQDYCQDSWWWKHPPISKRLYKAYVGCKLM